MKKSEGCKLMERLELLQNDINSLMEEYDNCLYPTFCNINHITGEIKKFRKMINDAKSGISISNEIALRDLSLLQKKG